MHLTRKSDGDDLSPLLRGNRHDVTNRCSNADKPVLRITLGPAGARLVDGMARPSDGEQTTIAVDEPGLGRPRTDVNTERDRLLRLVTQGQARLVQQLLSP